VLASRAQQASSSIEDGVISRWAEYSQTRMNKGNGQSKINPRHLMFSRDGRDKVDSVHLDCEGAERL